MGEWKDVPLIGQPYENADEAELDQWAASIVDFIPIVVEGKLNLVKRPGLTAYINLGTNAPIDGLYWFDKQRVVLAVSAGRVWKITDSGGTYAELTGSVALNKSQQVSFTDDGTRVAMANGNNIVFTDLATLTTATSNWPTSVTHVAYIDKYMVANNAGTGRCQFSLIGDITTCNASDIFESESNPDDLVAVQVAYREICMLGRNSVEFWYNDGVTPFTRIDGSAQPFGTEAPYSLCQVLDSWMWLDNNRRLVTMKGRSVQPVSSPYDRVLQRMQAVSDAIGYTVSIDGYPIYVLNFPTGRQTLAYNYITEQWHKWGYWDTGVGIYQRYRGQSYCFARAWNQHFVGDYANGIIYKADPLVYTDNGNPLRSMIRSGHISHGIDATKRSNIFRLKCKRGAGNDAVADPQITLRRRVNNKAKWTNERWKSLGQVGKHEIFIDWRRNGIYRTCQSELVHSDNSACAITSAQENIDVLGR